jgi:hypothetical protein
VARPRERKFLGFSFTAGPDIKRTIAPKSLERFKQRIREITRSAKGVSIKTTMEELATYMRGWRGYFGFCQTPEVLIALTRWVRSMENTTASPRGSCRKWGFGMGCKEHGRERPRSLVSRPKPGPLHWALECLPQIARPPILVPGMLAQLLEPPCTDPYARWCGRGGAARLPPIPICDPQRVWCSVIPQRPLLHQGLTCLGQAAFL